MTRKNERPGAWIEGLPWYMWPLKKLLSVFISDQIDAQKDTNRAIILLGWFFYVLGIYTFMYMIFLTFAFLGYLSKEFVYYFLFYPYNFLVFTYAGGKIGARNISKRVYRRRGEWFVIAWWIYTIGMVVGAGIYEVRGLTDGAETRWSTLTVLVLTSILTTIALTLSAATKRWRQVFGKGIFKGLIGEAGDGSPEE